MAFHEVIGDLIPKQWSDVLGSHKGHLIAMDSGNKPISILGIGHRYICVDLEKNFKWESPLVYLAGKNSPSGFYYPHFVVNNKEEVFQYYNFETKKLFTLEAPKTTNFECTINQKYVFLRST